MVEVDDIGRHVVDDKRMLKLTVIAIAAFALSCASAGNEAADFDVAIEQLDATPVERAGVLARMELGVTVTNRTEYPWRVDAVIVQSVTATHFTVPQTPQRWGQIVAPGHSNEFAFWTTVQATINFSKLRVPMRIRLDVVGPNGEKRTETFTREMEAWLVP